MKQSHYLGITPNYGNTNKVWTWLEEIDYNKIKLKSKYNDLKISQIVQCKTTYQNRRQ